MNRTLFLVLVLPLLAVECIAQFVLHDQQLTTVSALLGIGVIAVRWALGPQTAEESDCPVDCPKCAESRGDDLPR